MMYIQQDPMTEGCAPYSDNLLNAMETGVDFCNSSDEQGGTGLE